MCRWLSREWHCLWRLSGHSMRNAPKALTSPWRLAAVEHLACSEIVSSIIFRSPRQQWISAITAGPSLGDHWASGRLFSADARLQIARVCQGADEQSPTMSGAANSFWCAWPGKWGPSASTSEEILNCVGHFRNPRFALLFSTHLRTHLENFIS